LITPGSVSASPVCASPVAGFRTSPCTRVCTTAGATARASGATLRTSAVGSVSTGPAGDDDDRRRAHLVRASVFNSLPRDNVPTTARLVASGDIAPLTPVRLAPLAGAAVHVPVVGAGFASLSSPVTPFMFTLPTTAAMRAPFR